MNLVRHRKNKSSIKGGKVLAIIEEAHLLSEDISDLSIPGHVAQSLNVIIEFAIRRRANQSIYHALVILIIYKIYKSKQNIRKYKASMRGGFDARSFERKFVMPELWRRDLGLIRGTAFLTASLKKGVPYSKNYKGNFRNEELGEAFVNIVQVIQDQPEMNKSILRLLFNEVANYKRENQVEIKKANGTEAGVESIVGLLHAHMSANYGCNGGSRLCEILAWCLMRSTIGNIKKFKGCKVGKLKSPTTCDKSARAAGDVEVFSKDRLVLAVDTKLDVRPDEMVVINAKEKIAKHSPRNYWIVTSAAGAENHERLESMLVDIQRTHGCHVSIMEMKSWLRLHLHLLESPLDFLNEYFKAIEADEYLAKEHKDKANELFNEHFGGQ